MASTRPHSSRTRPYQPNVARKRTAPIQHERFMRPMNAGVLTSAMGGKLVPLTALGMHREEGMRTSRFVLTAQMSETAAMLLNPVRITARAFFVPKLAFERFKDMGTIDRSYNGEQEVDGSIVPWFQAQTEPGTNEILNTLGIHGAGNTDYVAAYNCIWNHLAAMMSPSLAPVTEASPTLQPAFWSNSQMKHVKPTFDDALLEGEVPLTITSQNMPVKGIGFKTAANVVSETYTEHGGEQRTYDLSAYTNWGNGNEIGLEADANGWPAVFAELQDNGITVSLANIDLARQTAAWARLRTQFDGVSEEWMIDQLLAGIRVRDEQLRHPIELDMAEGIVGMTQRFSTEAANLDKSMTDGSTALMLTAGLPAITCGGVFMVVAQALPEQMYERQKDFYFAAATVDDLPQRTADELDPQPVEMVKNEDVDLSHSQPDGLFGYRPLNAKWLKRHVAVGGKYLRANPADAWNENRNRLWTPDVVDPALGPDFYLSTELDHSVFVSSTEDAFEFWLSGVAQFEGLTYFGPALREAVDDYDKVLGQVPTDRLTGDGTDTPTAEAAE